MLVRAAPAYALEIDPLVHPEINLGGRAIVSTDFEATTLMPHTAPPSSLAESRLLLSEVMGAFSDALDMTEGQPPRHCLRSCWIGVHTGKELGLDAAALEMAHSQRRGLVFDGAHQ